MHAAISLRFTDEPNLDIEIRTKPLADQYHYSDFVLIYHSVAISSRVMISTYTNMCYSRFCVIEIKTQGAHVLLY